MFERGQRVRCVNAKGWTSPAGHAVAGPAGDCVYTVLREAVRPHAISGAPTRFVAVSEFGACRLFLADGFRPLEDAQFERLAALAATPELDAHDLLGCAA